MGFELEENRGLCKAMARVIELVDECPCKCWVHLADIKDYLALQKMLHTVSLTTANSLATVLIGGTAAFFLPLLPVAAALTGGACMAVFPLDLEPFIVYTN